MTNTFMKNKQLESKYNNALPNDVLAKREQEDWANQQMTDLMKKMHSPRNFQSIIRRPGQSVPYQNVNLARSIMLENHKLSLRNNSRVINKSTLSVNAMDPKLKNMNSFLNTSSQFDKNASTTLDGTQVSLNNQDISMRTDVDPADQAHNSMNLSLGKPTQSFALQPIQAFG
jgi:hypothetical protein